MKHSPAFTLKKLQALYKLLSAPMIDFDCGELCAPKNSGVPKCCDKEIFIPILYLDEYRYLRKKGPFWRKFRPVSKDDHDLVDDLADDDVAAVCPGAKKCRRSIRAFVCRTFPFEPYINARGEVLGLVYQEKHAGKCPLIGSPRSLFRDEYVRNSILFWKEVVNCLPAEKEMYMAESRKLRRKYHRLGKRLKILR